MFQALPNKTIHLATCLLFMFGLIGPLTSQATTKEKSRQTNQRAAKKQAVPTTATKQIEKAASILSLEKILKKDTSLLLILLLAFAWGILVSFTPCIYPMIPITASILSAQATTSGVKNGLLALSYVVGTGVAYASLGLFVALGGGVFGQWLGNPWFISFIIIFFLYFSFAMFGFYNLYIPPFLQQKRDIKPSGSILYSFFVGILAGGVASPCITPALFTLLLFVAQQGNPFLGFLVLFIFSLGMGLILIIIGMSSASLILLPKAGTWMLEIKRFFGFLLLATCIYIVKPLLAHTTTLLLIAVLMYIAGMYYVVSSSTLLCFCSKISPTKNYLAGSIKLLLGSTLLVIGTLFAIEQYFYQNNNSLFSTIINQIRQHRGG